MQCVGDVCTSFVLGLSGDPIVRSGLLRDIILRINNNIDHRPRVSRRLLPDCTPAPWRPAGGSSSSRHLITDVRRCSLARSVRRRVPNNLPGPSLVRTGQAVGCRRS